MIWIDSTHKGTFAFLLLPPSSFSSSSSTSSPHVTLVLGGLCLYLLGLCSSSRRAPLKLYHRNRWCMSIFELAKHKKQKRVKSMRWFTVVLSPSATPFERGRCWRYGGETWSGEKMVGEDFQFTIGEDFKFWTTISSVDRQFKLASSNSTKASQYFRAYWEGVWGEPFSWWWLWLWWWLGWWL